MDAKYFLVVTTLMMVGCTDYKGTTVNPAECISHVEVGKNDVVRFTRSYICDDEYCRSYKFNSAGVCEALFFRKLK